PVGVYRGPGRQQPDDRRGAGQNRGGPETGEEAVPGSPGGRELSGAGLRGGPGRRAAPSSRGAPNAAGAGPGLLPGLHQRTPGGRRGSGGSEERTRTSAADTRRTVHPPGRRSTRPDEERGGPEGPPAQRPSKRADRPTER